MKRILHLLPLLLLAFCVSVHAAELPVSSPSVILMEKETGTILYAKGEHDSREPASVTKIMTLLLTMEAIDSGVISYEDIVVASAHAASMGGSQIWLKENEAMTVHDLLKAVCVVSGNDAAVALGEHLAGSEELFVEKMNVRAKELGMNDTNFVNCTGLPAEGHTTSAYDIALMSRELIRNHPDIRQFTTIWTDSLRGGTSLLVNTNKLIRYYDGATGLKTGSTDSARYCISATAEKGGMELIAVVLYGTTSDERFTDAKTLLNYGFSTYALSEITPEEPLPEVGVTLGEISCVQTELTKENKLLLEKSTANGLKQTVVLPEAVNAPIAAGDQLGELRVTDSEGNRVATLPILASESVARVTWWQMMQRLVRAALCAA